MGASCFGRTTRLLLEKLRPFGLAFEYVANHKLPKNRDTPWAQTAGMHRLNWPRKNSNRCHSEQSEESLFDLFSHA